jgi:isopenicillin N synthase-like dioxygenase
VGSEVWLEYCQRIRGVVRELLKGISESLGLEASYILKAMNMESAGLQSFVANLYPPCPQPDLAMGLPPHSDHGLLTVVTQNGIGGLQLQRNGKWVNVHALPNSLLVNTSDQLEVIMIMIMIIIKFKLLINIIVYSTVFLISR